MQIQICKPAVELKRINFQISYVISFLMCEFINTYFLEKNFWSKVGTVEYSVSDSDLVEHVLVHVSLTSLSTYGTCKVGPDPVHCDLPRSETHLNLWKMSAIFLQPVFRIRNYKLWIRILKLKIRHFGSVSGFGSFCILGMILNKLSILTQMSWNLHFKIFFKFYERNLD